MYHILIYGCVVRNSNENIICRSPFNEYYSGSTKFIGLKFDRVDGLFQDNIQNPEMLIISGSEPSQQIKDIWHLTYPDIEGKCYCISQNVTFHNRLFKSYILYGYFFNTNNFTVSTALNKIVGAKINDMILHGPNHNRTYYFYGKKIGKLTYSDDYNDYNDYELLAENIRKVYSPCEIPTVNDCIIALGKTAKLLKSSYKDILILNNPVITVITHNV
jgi:hypothetical protein